MSTRNIENLTAAEQAEYAALVQKLYSLTLKGRGSQERLRLSELEARVQGLPGSAKAVAR